VRQRLLEGVAGRWIRKASRVEVPSLQTRPGKTVWVFPYFPSIGRGCRLRHDKLGSVWDDSLGNAPERLEAILHEPLDASELVCTNCEGATLMI